MTWATTPLIALEDMICNSQTFITSIGGQDNPHNRVHWLANEYDLGGSLIRPFAIISTKTKFLRDGISSSYELRAMGKLSLLLSADAEAPEDMKASVKKFMEWYSGIIAEIADQSGSCSGTLPIVEIDQELEPMRTLQHDRDTDTNYDFWNVVFNLDYGL